MGKFNFWKAITESDNKFLQALDPEALRTPPFAPGASTILRHDVTTMPLPQEQNVVLTLNVNSCRVLGPHNYVESYGNKLNPQVWHQESPITPDCVAYYLLVNATPGIDDGSIEVIQQNDEAADTYGGFASDAKMSDKECKWSKLKSNKYTQMEYSDISTVLFGTSGGQQLEFLVYDEFSKYSSSQILMTRTAVRAMQNCTINIHYKNLKNYWSEAVWQEIVQQFRIDGTFKRFI